MVKRDPPRGHCWAGGLFAVTVIRDYGRETAAARQSCWKKAVYLSVLSNPARASAGDAHASCAAAGITGRNGRAAGVRWFAVTDEQGTIVMHSNSAWWENSFIPRRKCSSYIRE